MFMDTIAAILLLAQQTFATSVVIPNVLHNGTTIAESVSIAGNLDGPKLTPAAANSTTYDWWYFHSVSESTNASLFLTLYNDGPDGFINPPGVPLPLGVSLTGSFANGTLFGFTAVASEAVVDCSEEGLDGEWKGTGFKFHGSSLAQPDVTYTVTIDAPDLGVEGTVTFNSRAPAHYGCALDQPNISEELVPGVYWSNALPDALSSVDLTIGDTSFAFSDGLGFHDKNWGDRPFVGTTSTWHWAQANLGPYSAGLFDVVDSNGVEHLSSFVTYNGEVLVCTCAPDSVTISVQERPGQGGMEALKAQWDLGDGSKLIAEMTAEMYLADVDGYVRAFGPVTGHIDRDGCESKLPDGRAVFDEIVF